MPYMASNFADLVLLTLSDYEKKKPKYRQIAQQYVDYEVLSSWMKKDKIIVSGGKNISRNLMVKTLGAARHRGFLEQDQVQLGDYGQQITVEWCYADTTYGFHKILDQKMHKGEKKLADKISMARDGAFIDIADVMEPAGFGTPSSATDTTTPMGLTYWIVKDSTIGFNGGAPFGSTVGGVNVATYPKFKNYSGTYSAATYDDLVVPLEKAHFETGFKSPMGAKEMGGRKGRRWRLYTNIDTKINLDKIARNQNDNLGIDIAKMDGVSVFKGHPIIPVHYLSADTANPIYFVDHDTFYPVVLEGCFFTETVDKDPNNHNIVWVFVEIVYNYICVDRRRNGVLYAA